MDSEDEGTTPDPMLLSAARLIADDSQEPSSSKDRQSVLEEVIKLAEELQPGIEDSGRPCISLQCMQDNFVQNKKLEPIFNLLSGTRKAKESNMKKFLWHSFSKRCHSKSFITQDQPMDTPKAENSPDEAEIQGGDAWVKFEDLPIFSREAESEEKDEESEEGKMDVDELSSQPIQSVPMDNDDRITVAEFLDQCQSAKGEEFDGDFVNRLCSQSESNLAVLFASCSSSDIFIPLLLTSANRHIELVVPLCEQILVPLGRREELSGQILANTCSLVVSYPMMMAGHFVVPLVRDKELKGVVIKVIKVCSKEEVHHAVLSALLNSSGWNAKLRDLELLQCLMSVSVPKNLVTVQLLCQMFVDADSDLKSTTEFAKLLLKTIQALKGDLSDDCRALLKTAVSTIKSPLKTIMEKQLQ